MANGSFRAARRDGRPSLGGQLQPFAVAVEISHERPFAPPLLRPARAQLTAARRSHRPRASSADRAAPHRTRNPPPNRRIVVPPITLWRCFSPTSKRYSRSCVPYVASRCASSLSSPIPRPCATSSSISAKPPRCGVSHRPGDRRCGTYPMRGRLTSIPTPSRPPGARSINASLGNPDRRPLAACDAGRCAPAAAGTRHELADARETPEPRATLALARQLTIPASRWSGQVKARYGAPVGASWGWICYPSISPARQETARCFLDADQANIFAKN